MTHTSRVMQDDIGADAAQVLSDLATERFAKSVQVEFMEGPRSGVDGTPTFFIDGERFDGDWQHIDQLAAAIERAATDSAAVALGSARTDRAADFRSAVFQMNAKKLVHHKSAGTPSILPRSFLAEANNARNWSSVKACGSESGGAGF